MGYPVLFVHHTSESRPIILLFPAGAGRFFVATGRSTGVCTPSTSRAILETGKGFAPGLRIVTQSAPFAVGVSSERNTGQSWCGSGMSAPDENASPSSIVMRGFFVRPFGGIGRTWCVCDVCRIGVRRCACVVRVRRCAHGSHIKRDVQVMCAKSHTKCANPMRGTRHVRPVCANRHTGCARGEGSR